MLTSGETAKATNGDAAVSLIANEGGAVVRSVTVINESAVGGFFTVDGGNTWPRLPANSAPTVDLSESPKAVNVQVKREPGAADLTKVWAWAE